MLKSPLHILILLLLPAILIACSSADGDAPGQAPDADIRLTISSRSSGTPEDASGDNELIRSWWVAFQSRTTGRIVSVLSDSLTAAAERAVVDGIVPAGAYRVWAFANLSKAQVRQLTGYTFEKDSALPNDEETIDALTWDDFPALWSEGENVPMTGIQDIEVKGILNETFTIEVVRMLAKIEFQFGSKSGSKPITVTGAWMTPLRHGSNWLFPDKSTLGEEPLEAPDGVTYSEETYTFGSPLPVAVGAEPSASTSRHFYIAEGKVPADYHYQAGHPSGRFLVGFNMQREDGSTDNSTAITASLEHVNRNDHVVIPIYLTDWHLEFDCTFYPPIGGYPAVMVMQENNEYFTVFGTPGKFVINPHLREAREGSGWLADSQYTMTATLDHGQSADIFVEEPEKQTNSHEIIGELSTSTGQAVVNIQVSVTQKVDGQTTEVTHTFDRTFYIIRQ